MNILCAGINDVDAGKTTLSIALLRYLKGKEHEACGFKPRSGNNLWYHWDIVKEGLKKGCPYSHDATLLKNESSENPSITLLNPVHRVWSPSSEELQWEQVPHFLLDRITIKDKNIIALNECLDLPIDSKYLEETLRKNEVISISSRRDLEALNNLYDQADDWAYSLLSRKFNFIVCESYCNIAVPWNGLTNLDHVFVIEPFRVRVYQGDRYLKSLQLISTLPFEEETFRVIEPLEPIQEIHIPPFSGNIAEKLKNHLSPYLDELFTL
ncbi:MAG: hypothetical protein EU539_04755 [Promethearchaeota archaeon]|nr:MAG: hypothetical protein EU539_04755 [Candidatus Lokiarchaeota archaeon]